MPTVSYKFGELIRRYARTQIEFPNLKAVTVAQWILESGWGRSMLAELYNNFGGLKYRREMAGVATPQPYWANDGEDIYCSFFNLDSYIQGYWVFLSRSPYVGWKDHAFHDEDFIRFIARIYNPGHPEYPEKILNLLPEARRLIDPHLPVNPAPIPTPRPGTPVPPWQPPSHTGTNEPVRKPYIRRFLQSPHAAWRDGFKIQQIIMHYTAGSTVQGAVNTYLNPWGTQASTHYLIDKNGDVYQLVRDSDKAFHTPGANRDSLGVTVVALPGERMTPAQERITISLIKWMMSEYKVPASKITAHRFVPGASATQCPGSLFGSATFSSFQSWVKRNFG